MQTHEEVKETADDSCSHRWVFTIGGGDFHPALSVFPSPTPVLAAEAAEVCWTVNMQAQVLTHPSITQKERQQLSRHGIDRHPWQWVRHGECLPDSSTSSPSRPRTYRRNEREQWRLGNMKEAAGREDRELEECVCAQFGEQQQPLMLWGVSSVW